ncbi:peptidoglycan -binding protein [Pyruvatibacter sp. HU-CL02332]|uniref:peptidoglycan -binding protein n=1 Tax=Pyruvatibacter sp. HU-CL02332 TaxID=3127650 RepID=UPI00310775DB
MPLASRRIRQGQADYWPGFVDAMATLLLVIIFLLSIFMLSQFYLSQAITGKDSALESLRAQISQLTDLLALEQLRTSELETSLTAMTASLASAEEEQSRLSGLLLSAEAGGDEANALRAELTEQEKLTAEAQAQVELFNQQLAALRSQLSSLEAALEAAEAKDKANQTQIADLGRRLNSALAQKVQELARARSEFFGRLRVALGNRDDIQIVGDRFVFQSEVFFDSGSAALNPAGQTELNKIATAIREIAGDVPDDINWVLRIDGHSDSQPISTPEFPSNWHLSAGRAISVVRYLIDQGVPPNRLLAAGFGEFQPLADGASTDDLRRNRRIEFKLTER